MPNGLIEGYEWLHDLGHPSASSFYGSDPANAKSLYVNTHASAVTFQSNYAALAGGAYFSALGAQLYAAGAGGTGTGPFYSYDQPEGWMIPFPPNYGGFTDGTGPWFDTSFSYRNNTDVAMIHTSQITGTQNLLTPDGNVNQLNPSFTTVDAGTGYVLRLRNSRASSQEIITKPYGYGSTTGFGAKEYQCFTPPDGQWFITWYAKKSNNQVSGATLGDNSGNVTVRMTCHAFGLDSDLSNSTYNSISGNSGGNCSNYRTRENPLTGHTRYYRQVELTTDWQKFSMSFKFNGNTEIKKIGIRWDLDDGDNAGQGRYTECYIHRPTMHPVNVSMTGMSVTHSGSSTAVSMTGSAYVSNLSAGPYRAGD